MKPTYEELEAKCLLQQNKLDAINKLMGVIEGVSDLAKSGIEKLEQQLAAVVAENAGLKIFGETLFEMHNALNGSGTGIQGNYEAVCQQLGLEAAMDALDDIKTPATDAAIASIQAQGVEMYAVTLDRGADDAERNGFEDGMKFLRAEAESVREFAAQLRQGAAL